MALKAIWKQALIFISGLALLLSLTPALAYADGIKIESVTIPDIETPVAGTTPTSVYPTIEGDAYVEMSQWLEIEDGHLKGYMPSGRLFMDGGCYTLSLNVLPKSGFVFEDTEVIYNGTALGKLSGPEITTSYISSQDKDGMFVNIVFDKTIAPDNADNGLFVVNAGSLNVRDAKDGNRIGGLSCGEVVKVLVADGEWSKIACGDIEGWVKSEFLLRTYSKETATPEPAKYTVTAANSINVRKNILVASERIGGLEKGDVFYVTGKRTNSFGELWYVVDYDGKLAYVKADLVAPEGQKPQSAPSVFDKIIDSLMLHFSGSSAPSTTAKRMIYREGAAISTDSIKDNGDGSYEIVLFPDDGYNLSGVDKPEDVKLSSDEYVVDSVIANEDGSKTVRMVKRSADDPAGQTPSGDSNQQSGSSSSDSADNSAQQPDSSSSDSAGATAKTGDSVPVLFLSVLLSVSLAVCVGSGMYGRRRNRL